MKTERQYLRTLVDGVSISDWQAIVQRAVADAIGGDKDARAWLGNYLLGAKPMSLAALAAEEVLDPTGRNTLVEGVAQLLLYASVSKAHFERMDIADDFVSARERGVSVAEFVAAQFAEREAEDPDDDLDDDDLHTP